MTNPGRELLATLRAQIEVAEMDAREDMARLREEFSERERARWQRFENEVEPLRRACRQIVSDIAAVEVVKPIAIIIEK